MKLYNFSKKLNFLFLSLFLSFLFVNILPANANSNNLELTKILKVENNQIIDGNLYSTAQDVIIDGQINGDLIVFANNIEINGEISGDLLAIASNIEINGKIQGNLRAIAENISVNGQINKNISSISTSLNLEKDSYLAWDLFALSEESNISGDIKGNINIYSNKNNILGTIFKNVNVNILTKEGFLNINESAEIKGDLNYKYFKDNNFENKGIISGIIKNELKTNNKFIFSSWFLKTIFLIFAALAIGFVLIYLFKDFFNNYLNKKIQLNKIILPGSLAFFITPLIIIALLFTIIAIPLSFIIFCLYLILIYFSKIITAFLISKLLFKNIFKLNNLKNIYTLIFGVFILWFSFSLPYAGKLISLISSIIGLGFIINYVKNKSKNF